MPRVAISDRAWADLAEIWEYIADDNISAADRMADAFDEKFQTLARNPGLGVSRDDLAPGIRSFPLKSYLVFYLKIDGGIEIARVISGARDLPAQF